MRPTRTAARTLRKLRVTVTNAIGAPARAPGLARWLADAAPARARGTVTIALVSDRRMKTLNRCYRGVDRPTDVLSFPNDPKGSYHDDPEASSHIGDLAISTDTARRQARERGHSLATELRVLALHGLLHLLGYDHEHDDGEMARLERRLGRGAGLRPTLTERT